MEKLGIDKIIKPKIAAYIYFVDHDSSYSASLKKAIDKPEKYSIEIFTTGEKFIAHLTTLKFRKDDIHIVFLGYQFIDEGEHTLMNGIEVLDAIKVINSDIEVVMLTGQDEGSYGSYAKKSGAFAFVPKNDTVFLRIDNIIMRIISHRKLNLKRKAFYKSVKIFVGYCILLAIAAILFHFFFS